MKLADDVRQVLACRTSTDGNRLVLTGDRLDPKLYARTDEMLEAIGGRWTTAVQAHVFSADARAAVDALLLAGEAVTAREKRTSAQFFPTPAPVVRRLLELAGVQPGMEVLEPSAGSGAIAAALVKAGAVVDCIERDPGYAALLTDVGAARVTVADFLSIRPGLRYDRVVMNPPFTRGADIAHVEHALRLLKPGGLLVAVMSIALIEFPERTAAFRALVESRCGTIELVDEGAFRASGTDMATVLVTIPATRPAGATPTRWPVRTRRAATPDPRPQYDDPRKIAQEIVDNLRSAASEFEAVFATLGEPLTESTGAGS